MERMLYCHMCRKQTLHSVLKKRTEFLEGVEKITYSKICPNHEHIHDFEETVSISDWKALLKYGKNWKVGGNYE